MAGHRKVVRACRQSGVPSVAELESKMRSAAAKDPSHSTSCPKTSTRSATSSCSAGPRPSRTGTATPRSAALMVEGGKSEADFLRTLDQRFVFKMVRHNECERFHVLKNQLLCKQDKQHKGAAKRAPAALQSKRRAMAKEIKSRSKAMAVSVPVSIGVSASSSLRCRLIGYICIND